MTSDLVQALLHMPTRVKTYRTVKRMSQRGLADEVGISFATISRIEAGHDYNVSSLMPLVTYLEEHP